VVVLVRNFLAWEVVRSHYASLDLVHDDERPEEALGAPGHEQGWSRLIWAGAALFAVISIIVKLQTIGLEATLESLRVPLENVFVLALIIAVSWFVSRGDRARARRREERKRAREQEASGA